MPGVFAPFLLPQNRAMNDTIVRMIMCLEI
jgi:hypothetical protein